MSAGAAIDDDEFRALYERTAPRLAAYLRSLVGRPEIADEIAQEAFVRLLTSAPAGLDRRQRAGWLYTTATRLVRDGWRRQGVDRRWRERSAPEWTGGPVAAELESAGLDPDLERALARLDRRQRSLLWLAYVEELSHREIAAAVGVGERSVKVLLFRARRKLARALEGLGLAPDAGDDGSADRGSGAPRRGADR